MKLEINGQVVEVDDSFENLSDAEKEATVNEIAASLSPAPAAQAAPDTVNPLYGIGGGAAAANVLGRPINKFYEGADKVAPPAGGQGLRTMPQNVPPEIAAKGPDAVENWARTQHAGEFYGGKDYAGAHQRAMDVKATLAETPGYKAVQGTGLIAPREAVEGYEASKAATARRAMPLTQRLIESSPAAGRTVAGASNILRAGVPPFVGRTTAGGVTGYLGVDAYNRAQEGDIPGAVISGAGALGSGLTMVPRPKVRGLGILGAATALGANALRDKEEKPKKKSVMEGYAKGGLAYMADGRKAVVQEGLSAAKKLFTPKPTSVMREKLIGKEPPSIKNIKNQTQPLWEKFGYDPKKVSLEYPEMAPPVMKPKEKGEGLYAAKQLSPEAEAVQRARKAAQAEIDKGQYTPFFDISKRSYVNPADYPLTGRTLTDVLPKKAETIEEYRMLAESPEATARLKAAFAEGSKAPLAKDWYAMKQLEDEFVKELGPEAGKLAFRQRFAEPMAATTGGADPTSNLMMTAYTNFMREKGMPIPTEAYNLPFPIGGRYVSGNMKQAAKYHQEGSIPVDNPKRHNFASNFMGYRDRPTIDEQMMGLFAPGKGAPEPNTYGVYEAALNKLAKEAGVEPVNFQDVSWAGAKQYQGKPMMEEINQMIYRTSRITGQSPEEVLKGYIHSNRPMYGITGLGALGVEGADGVNNPD